MEGKNNIKPNLFIPGAAKSATSTLHDMLNIHPEIFMSEIKEPHYFTNNVLFKNSEKYYSLFREKGDVLYRGESSTGYMVFPEVPSNILSEIGEGAKFIFILRNPVDRAFSHYSWVRSKGREKRSFENAFLYDINDELNSNNHLGFGYKNYFKFGLYAEHLNRFFKVFPRENILVITSESLKNNPLQTLNHCFRFLGVAHLESIAPIQRNKTNHYFSPWLFYKGKALSIRASRLIGLFLGKERGISLRDKYLIPFLEKTSAVPPPKLTLKQREWLKSYYYQDVALLKELISQNLDEWKDFKNDQQSPDE